MLLCVTLAAALLPLLAAGNQWQALNALSAESADYWIVERHGRKEHREGKNGTGLGAPSTWRAVLDDICELAGSVPRPTDNPLYYLECVSVPYDDSARRSDLGKWTLQSCRPGFAFLPYARRCLSKSAVRRAESSLCQQDPDACAAGPQIEVEQTQLEAHPCPCPVQGMHNCMCPGAPVYQPVLLKERQQQQQEGVEAVKTVVVATSDGNEFDFKGAKTLDKRSRFEFNELSLRRMQAAGCSCQPVSSCPCAPQLAVTITICPCAQTTNVCQCPTQATTRRPVYTTRPPVFTTQRPVYTTRPPVYTTRPPVYTTQRPVYTTRPPVYTTQRPVYTTRPPVYTTQRPPQTTAPPVILTPQPCQQVQGGDSGQGAQEGAVCSWMLAPLAVCPCGAQAYLQCAPAPQNLYCGRWTQMPCAPSTIFDVTVQVCTWDPNVTPGTLPPATQPPYTQPPYTQPPVTYTQPPYTQPPVTYTQPPYTQPPVTYTQTYTLPPVTYTQPPYTQPPYTQPPVTYTQPPVTYTQPPYTQPTTRPPTGQCGCTVGIQIGYCGSNYQCPGLSVCQVDGGGQQQQQQQQQQTQQQTQQQQCGACCYFGQKFLR